MSELTVVDGQGVGEVDWKAEAGRLKEKLSKVRQLLEVAVCTEGDDKGVILLSQDGPTHPEVWNGKTVQVYDHEFFSPLGDTLIEAWTTTREDDI